MDPFLPGYAPRDRGGPSFWGKGTSKHGGAARRSVSSALAGRVRAVSSFPRIGNTERSYGRMDGRIQRGAPARTDPCRSTPTVFRTGPTDVDGAQRGRGGSICNGERGGEGNWAGHARTRETYSIARPLYTRMHSTTTAFPAKATSQPVPARHLDSRAGLRTYRRATSMRWMSTGRRFPTQRVSAYSACIMQRTAVVPVYRCGAVPDSHTTVDQIKSGFWWPHSHVALCAGSLFHLRGPMGSKQNL